MHPLSLLAGSLLVLSFSTTVYAGAPTSGFAPVESRYRAAPGSPKGCTSGDAFWVDQKDGKVFTVGGRLSIFVPNAQKLVRRTGKSRPGCTLVETTLRDGGSVRETVTEECVGKKPSVLSESVAHSVGRSIHVEKGSTEEGAWTCVLNPE